VLDPVAKPEKSDESPGIKTKIGNGAVICMAENLLPLDTHNWCVPVWMI
jgi:hypothetical protein